MQFRRPSGNVPWVRLGLILAAALAARTASAQPAPGQEPIGSAPSPTPPIPSPAVPPPAVVSSPAVPYAATAPGGLSREAQLEAEVRELKAMVNKLADQVNSVQQTTAKNADTLTDIVPNIIRPRSGGPNAPGQSLPPNPPVSARFDSPATLENKRAAVKFGPGFEIRTEDDEFFLQFHNLTQFDYRGYTHTGPPEGQLVNPAFPTRVHDTFSFPRQWFMFSGRITKPIGYFVSFANGFDVFSILDVFVDFNADPKFNMRVGRFKTPFTYEFLVEPIQGLIIPERSLGFNNFGQNRDLGAMAYGRVLNNSVDYAVGVFNGSRNALLANNDAKAVSGFVNWRPFGEEKNTLLENLNLGGSVFAGNHAQVPSPQTFRTEVATLGSFVMGVPFLSLNNNVRETGDMAFWDAHFAYFYQQLAVIGEYLGGFQDYALANTPANRTHLPVQSFYVQAGYMLTGETRSSVGIVKPLHPFDLRKGAKCGIGAWELTGRYNYLDIGNQVFTQGFADPNNWANRVSMTDVGLNWHMTQYVKIYFDWQHSEFNNPVLFAPGRRQAVSDTFLARLQLYF